MKPIRMKGTRKRDPWKNMLIILNGSEPAGGHQKCWDPLLWILHWSLSSDPNPHNRRQSSLRESPPDPTLASATWYPQRRLSKQFTMYPETGAHTSVIVKAFDNLSAADVKENWHVEKIKRLQELRDLFDLGCYKRMPRSRAKIVVDVKWVDKWENDQWPT